MSILRELLEEAVTHRQASDIHIKVDQRPFIRVHGELAPSRFEPLSCEEVDAITREIMPAHVVERFRTQFEVDFSFAAEDIGRFRVNVFRGQGFPTIAMRYVKAQVPTVEVLNLPPILKDLALSPRGIVVVSGTTGAGKSSTLAAMIQEINGRLCRRIITIEDPIEFAFQDEQSIITQREVDLDTPAFKTALRHVIRQDPDVIMIGEMRDVTSFTAALEAAETGHFVMTTLHAGTASQAIHRLLDLFPSTERHQVRMAIASNMRAIVCQRLVPAVAGGVRPAVEIMVNTGTVRKLIERDQLETLDAAIETGREDGMQTFNQSVYELIVSGTVTEKEGMRFATNPSALRMNLQGIFLDEGRRILSNE